MKRDRGIAGIVAGVLVAIACCISGSAQKASEVHRIFAVSAEEPVLLDLYVSKGDVQVLYDRDGQISITGIAQADAGTPVNSDYFPSVLEVDQDGNKLKIRHHLSSAYPEDKVRVLYRIDVPYWTEIISKVDHGTQIFTGVMGPVHASGGKGNLRASFISRGVQVQLGTGNVDLNVIGEHATVTTGNGNISCSRAAQGVSAETGDGDIALTVVGPSSAKVSGGNGKIDVGGARGKIMASSSAGDIHVKAFPHDDWQLRSEAGTIRLELPPAAKVDLEVAAGSGDLQFERTDLPVPNAHCRRFHHAMNGGGKHIDAYTMSGSIVVQ